MFTLAPSSGEKVRKLKAGFAGLVWLALPPHGIWTMDDTRSTSSGQAPRGALPWNILPFIFYLPSRGEWGFLIGRKILKIPNWPVRFGSVGFGRIWSDLVGFTLIEESSNSVVATDHFAGVKTE
jgi:hypothetical protein